MSQAGRDSQSTVSLAVVPFSRGPDQAEALPAAGMADGIISRLSSVRQFRVRPTSAMERSRGKEIDAQEVGRDLRSHYVLVGTLRTAAGGIRVSVQLVDATNGSRSGAIGTTLPAAICWEWRTQSPAKSPAHCESRLRMAREGFHRRYTRSGAAYEKYLMGRARLRSATEQDTRLAIAEIEAACDLDSERSAE